MAEEPDDSEQTEDPTPRRLEQAIQRGDVVKSIEVSTWFMIGGATVALIRRQPAKRAARLAGAFLANPDRRAIAGRSHPVAWRNAARNAWHSAPATGFVGLRRHDDSAPHYLLVRAAEARTVENLADRRFQAAFLQSGARQFRQGLRQALLVRHRHRSAVVAAAPPHGRAYRRGSGADPSNHPVACHADARHDRRDPRGRDGSRLSVSVPAVVRPA